MAGTGLGRNAYNDAVKAARDAAALADLESSLARYTEERDGCRTLVRTLRQVHVDNYNVPGADYLANTVSELDYRVSTLTRSVNSTQQSIDRLKGTAPVVDDDDN